MNVSQALDSRISCRAFLDKPVPRQMIEEILRKAARSPSGGNLQPWHVYVLGGDRLKEFVELITDKMSTNPEGDGAEYDIYPPDITEPYKSRRWKCGEDMYAAIPVAREDRAGRMLQFLRNFRFFDAPMAIFFAIDRQMGLGQWADMGMFIQSIMLLAREHGLHTCAQEAWALWPQTIARFVNIPAQQMLFCGLALGYMDNQARINSLRTERAPVHEFATFDGI